MQRVVLFILLCLCVWAAPARAQIWQDGNLAVRTNGNLFQSGDALKVEIVALEEINERFYTRVTYGYTETVKAKDDEGKEIAKQESRTIKREVSPIFENLRRFQLVGLDDSFHFGDASPTGAYHIEVAILQPHTNRPLATLKACVFFQQRDGDCPTDLRALRSVNHQMFLTFDGTFDSQARYSVTLLSRRQVISFTRSGAFTNGRNTLQFASEKLDGTAGNTYDILLHDHRTGHSSTLSRVTIAEIR